MSLTIENIYLYAKVAAAGYVDLTGLPDFDPVTLRNKASGEPSPRMPTSLGNQFFLTDGWRVVSDPRHPPGANGSHNDPNSGFAATLFQRGTTGEKVLSIRGTDPDNSGQINLDLLRTDLYEIGILGIAISQTASLFNLVQRMMAPEGQTGVLQLSLGTSLDQPPVTDFVRFELDPNISLYRYFWLEANADGVGVGGINPGEAITVVGHSLGGHLAAMAHRLFPDLFPQAVVFNSARYDPFTSAKLARQFLDLFRPFGANPAAEFRNVLMFDSEDQAPGDDTSFVSSLIAGQLYGSLTNVTTEANSHVIEPFMDSLALQALVSSMNSTMTLIDTGKLLASVSDKEENTDEQLLQDLYRLLKGTSIAPLAAFRAGLMSAGDIQARQEFYSALIALEAEVKNRSDLRLFSLVDVSAEDLANIAQGSEALGYRYALKEVNPFVILGDNSIYIPHGRNGELEIYDPVNHTGALTVEWSTDRAKLLHAELIRNAQDNPDLARLPDPGDRVTEYHHYRDGREQVFFAQPADTATGQLPTEVVMFADDTGRLLVGSGNLLGDRLYGGASTDYLWGRTSDDSLEGGRGLDIYQYSASSNGADDGADTIRDIDGKGVLRYTYTQSGFFSSTTTSTVIADASVRISGIEWNSADGKFSFTRRQNDLIVTINDGSGGSITLKEFKDGNFGIHLWEARPEPQNPIRIFHGDKEDWDSDPSQEGVQPAPDGFGNTLRADGQEGRPDIAAVGRDDFFYGSSGTEVEQFLLGAGNDQVMADGASSAISTAGGADWIRGGAGRDDLTAGAGADLIEAGADGVFDGELGGDIAFGALGDDEIYADAKIPLATAITEGNAGAASGIKGDYLNGGGGDDWIIASSANDMLTGGSGKDLIVAGAGDDNIDGDLGWAATTPLWVVQREILSQEGQTLYQLSYQSGVVTGLDTGPGTADVVYAGAGADWIYAREGDDFVDAGPGDDVAFGMEGSDVLIGGLGNDFLVGDNGLLSTVDGSDYLDGGAGDDRLQGDGGADVLVGGPGNDTLSGGAGRDIYVFDRGDGVDTVFDTDANSNGPDASVLVLGEGISRSAIKFRVGSLAVDLGPVDPGNPDSLHEVIHFEGFNQVDPAATTPLAEIRFADGSSLSYADILAQGFDIDGTEGNDNNYPGEPPRNLVGTGVTDRIRGFGGDDLLFGLAGDDLLDGGDGADQLIGGAGTDTLYGGAGDDRIWADGESAGVAGPDGADVVHAGSGNDVVQGYDGDDRILGEEDNDALYGDFGADSIEGGPGNDYLYGQGYFYFDGIPYLDLFDDAAPDTLVGGAGNDYLNAAAGNDLLEGGSGDDVLVAGAGADFLAGREGNDFLEGDEADSPVADQGNDTLDGGAGADQLVGHAGNDTYIFARGYDQDLVFDQDASAGNLDQVRFAADITPDDVTATRGPVFTSDLVLAINGTADALTIANQFSADLSWRVEEIRFADGTVWTPITTPLLIQGTAANNVLNGTAGADVIEGLAGNDTLQGGAGSDRYRFYRGDGADLISDSDATPGNMDKVLYAADILPSEIRASRTGDNLILQLAGTTDQVTINNYFQNDGVTSFSVEEIKFFSDGTAWDVNTVKQMVLIPTTGSDNLVGYATDDALAGLGGNDTLTGNAGDDTLDGGTGNDVLQGGTGNDTYLVARGDGLDTVIDNDPTAGNVDTLRYAADILPADVKATRAGNDLVLAMAGAADRITVINYFENDGSTAYSLERIEFPADGTVWDVNAVKALVLTGTAGTDVITGYATDDALAGLGGDDFLSGHGGNDTLDGGTGNDSLSGEDGSDHYLFARGDGQDVITNGAFDTAGTTDVLSFSMDILPSDVTLSRIGNDLVLSIQATNDQVTIRDYFVGGANVVEEIRFADGTIWTEQTVLSFLPPPSLAGSEGDDILQGTGASELLKGLGGNDTLRGAGGHDTLDGGLGGDRLYGEDGNDFLVAGTGETKNAAVSNYLYGGAGDDVLISSGKTDFLYGEAGNDVLLGSGGRDWLEDSGGSNLIFGGAGLDDVWAGNQNDLLIGGKGDDFIDADRDGDGIRGRDILLFNMGDGKDSVQRLGAGSTISIGGGALYRNLALSTDGVFLALKVGNNQMTFDWYGQPDIRIPANKAVSTLQIVIEGTRDYDADSPDPMKNRKIQFFDFPGLVAAFDAARAAGRRFNVADNLARFWLGSSDTVAIGGAIAYEYARNGSLDNLSYDQIRAVISAPGFGVSAQPIAVSPAMLAESNLSMESMGAAPLASAHSLDSEMPELTEDGAPGDGSNAHDAPGIDPDISASVLHLAHRSLPEHPGTPPAAPAPWLPERTNPGETKASGEALSVGSERARNAQSLTPAPWDVASSPKAEETAPQSMDDAVRRIPTPLGKFDGLQASGPETGVLLFDSPARVPHFHFEALAEYFETEANRKNPVLTDVQIAARWARVQDFIVTLDLAESPDEMGDFGSMVFPYGPGLNELKNEWGIPVRPAVGLDDSAGANLRRFEGLREAIRAL